jgi:hypothetical protein
LLRLLTKRESLLALIGVIRGDDQWPPFISPVRSVRWIFRLSGRDAVCSQHRHDDAPGMACKRDGGD